MAGCEGLDLPPPPSDEGFQLSMEIEVPPGEEQELCQPFLVDRDIALNWSDGLRSPGTHHGVVHRTTVTGTLPELDANGTAWDPTKPIPCDLISIDAGSAIADSAPVGSPQGTGTLSSKGVLPDDVAFRLASGEVLLVTLHMVNTTDHRVRACYKANFHGIPDEQIKYEAGMFRWPNSFITVPANGRMTAEMACPITQDIELAAASSHMHQRGVDYTALLIDGDPLDAPAELRTLHESKDWHQTVTPFPGALAVKQGQWVKWRCVYENREPRDIAQGFVTTDEMCQLNGVYWPRSQEIDDCGAGLGFPGMLGRPLAQGTHDGAYFKACFEGKKPRELFGGGPATSATRYAAQSCVTDLCPEVSGRVWEMLDGRVDPVTLGCR